MRLPRESPRSSRGAGVATRCSRSLKRIYLTSPSHNWPVWSPYQVRGRLCGSAGPFWPAAPARTPWPPPSPHGAAGTTSTSISASGSTTAAAGHAPARPNLDVTLCFAPLLRWVLTWWVSGRLAVAINPTLKGDQTTAIVISVVYRSCAIPVAWRIHRATQRGSWMDPTVELLRELAPAVPREMTVIVLCDRGISSPKLWKQIRAQSLPPTRSGGWHPCMRYRNNITFCADGGKRLPARRFVSVPGHGLDRTGHRLRHPQGPTPLHPAGGLVRRAGGTLDHPHRPAAGSSGSELVRSPLLDRTGLQSLAPATTGGHQEHGLEVGQDQKDQPHPRLPPLAWCFRWRRSWPWPTAPEPAPGHDRGAEDAHDRRIAPGNLRAPPKPLAPQHRNSWQKPKRKVSAFRRGIDWLAPFDAQGQALEPGLAAARTLAQTQAQPGNHLPRAPLKTLYIPLSAGPSGSGETELAATASTCAPSVQAAVKRRFAQTSLEGRVVRFDVPSRFGSSPGRPFPGFRAASRDEVAAPPQLRLLVRFSSGKCSRRRPLLRPSAARSRPTRRRRPSGRSRPLC